MEEIELVEYGVREQYQGGEIDAHNLVYIVFRYKGRLHCPAKPGRYPEIKRLSRTECNELLPEHEQIIKLLENWLSEQDIQDEYNINGHAESKPKKKSWLSRIIDWLYEVEMPDDFPEV